MKQFGHPYNLSGGNSKSKLKNCEL